MTDPCSIETYVSPTLVWWYGFCKWLVFGFMLLLLALLLGLRSLKTPAPVTSALKVPVKAPSPSFSITELRIGNLTPADAVGYVKGPIFVTGLGLPISMVQIKRDEIFVGVAMVDVKGRWSFQGDMRLLPGRYRFQALMLDERQIVIARSKVFEIIIPKIVLPQPPPLTTPDPNPILPRIIGVNRDREGNPLRGLYGRGRPNSRLVILKGGRVLGEIQVRDDGSWRCSCDLPPGLHTLRVREVGDRKQVSQPMVLNIANPAPPMVLPEVTREPAGPPVTCPDPLPVGEIRGDLYIIAACETLQRIALRLKTDLPTLMAHNPQIPNPNRVYAGQLLNIPSPESCSALN